ncbi:hypothetical protein Fmac_015110 [Flemingia macrophylla]|uniref:SHSP domain-containing protein n=1 Tax=Flemingia macrophylla TaxID=520843 RepID=A0ABD1MDM4_9FABA
MLTVYSDPNQKALLALEHIVLSTCSFILKSPGFREKRDDHMRKNAIGRSLTMRCPMGRETLEAHVFKADIHGLKKEHVKVEIDDGNILQIRGERNIEKKDKNDKWHQVERSSGKFFRKFRLSENAKEEIKKPDVKAVQNQDMLEWEWDPLKHNVSLNVFLFSI